MRNHILMLTSRSVYPLSAGYRLRIHYLAKLLAMRYNVDLLSLYPVNRDINNPSPFTKVFTFPISTPQFGFNAIQHWAKGWPLQVGGYFTKKVSAWLREYKEKYKILYVHHIRMATYAEEFEGCRILDYHDAISMHYRQSRIYAKGLWRILYALEGERLLHYELDALHRFSLAFVNSSVDRDYLLKHNNGAPHCPVEVLPMGVREEVFNYCRISEEAPWIAMIGRMAYYPNREAAIFFARSVYPKLKKQYKDLEFYILGSDPTSDVEKLANIPGVHVTGHVQDPWAYMARAQVVVAPIRLGAGIQNKILEAMALSKPVVATSLAAQGIVEGTAGRHFLIADTPDEMVEKISYIIDHKKQAEEMGREAHKLILEHYTWNRIGERLFRILENWI